MRRTPGIIARRNDFDLALLVIENSEELTTQGKYHRVEWEFEPLKCR